MRTLLIACFVIVIYSDKNYYSILGVPRNADERAIKQAYRKLTLEWHPDKRKDDPKASEKIAEINNGITLLLAYEILGDREKRRIYDVQGEQGLKDLVMRQSSGVQENVVQDLVFNVYISYDDIYTGKELKVGILAGHIRKTGLVPSLQRKWW